MSFITIPDEVVKETPSISISKEPYQGAVVDGRLNNVNTLATYVAGSRWKVDMYLKVSGRDDVSNITSTDLLAIHSQLRHVKGVVLLVTQDLQSRQEGEERHFTVTGSADVPHGITPNLGDIFVAEIGDGRNAILTVTSSERSTYHSESMTSIEYSISGYMDEEKAHGLQSKVIETFHYDEEYLRRGINPIIHESVINVRNKLRELYGILGSEYYRTFFSNRYKTLMLPMQAVDTYDPYLVRFIKATIDHDEFPEYRHVTVYSTNEDPYTTQNTLWELFLQGSVHLLPGLSKYAAVAPMARYRSRPLLNSIYYSGIEGVITMTDLPYLFDADGTSLKTIGTIRKAQVTRKEVDKILPITDLREHTPIEIRPEGGLPIINRVIKDGTYVFSESFYSGVAASTLEDLVLKRIGDGETNLNDLYKVASNSLTFNNLERFYYFPVIMTLIKLSDGVI